MKLAVSNIAWPIEQDVQVAELLSRSGVTGIEIAPTKIWPQPLAASLQQIADYRRFWEERGLAIVAAQALLFGRPELTLFENAETRARTLEYLRGIIRLCAQLGAQALVFGSPKNRRIEGQPREKIWPIAVEFFSQLGENAAGEGTCVVLEANPTEYGADFITSAVDAAQLVREVNQPGFRLHLDTACMTLTGDPPSTVSESIESLRHFHVSQPQLAPVGPNAVAHEQFAKQLYLANYAHWISIEMRQAEPFRLEVLEAAIEFTARTYQEPKAH